MRNGIIVRVCFPSAQSAAACERDGLGSERSKTSISSPLRVEDGTVVVERERERGGGGKELEGERSNEGGCRRDRE